MKKIISLILSVAMMVCVCVPAFAAEHAWTLTAAADFEGNGTVGTLEAGDIFYLMLDCAKGSKGLSLLLDIDTDVFEVALYEGADDVSGGNYTGAAVVNPNVIDDEGNETGAKYNDAISYTAATTAARPGALSGGYIGLQVKEGVATGDYTIAVSSRNDGVHNKFSGQGLEAVNTGNAVTVSVKGIDPAPIDPVDPDAIDDETVAGTDTDAKTKTWSVTVGKNVVGKALKATLTNSAYEGEKAVQVVDLTFDSSVSGDASCVFDVIVHFYNAANAATTSLDIALAN